MYFFKYLLGMFLNNASKALFDMLVLSFYSMRFFTIASFGFFYLFCLLKIVCSCVMTRSVIHYLLVYLTPFFQVRHFKNRPMTSVFGCFKTFLRQSSSISQVYLVTYIYMKDLSGELYPLSFTKVISQEVFAVYYSVI